MASLATNMAVDVINTNTSDLSFLGDITQNLKSLQFENALNEEEKEFLILKQRSHALTVAACAQATYFVSLLNEARQVKVQMRNPNTNKMSKLLEEGLVRDPLRVGVIGCGRFGGHLVKSLLTFGEVQPEEMCISTRRPESLVNFQDQGVQCIFDNKEVAEFADILFICVLPSQLPAIAERIKAFISPSTIVYSFASSIPASKMAHLFSHKNVLRPMFEWSDSCKELSSSWEAKEIADIFSDQNDLKKTCPLQMESDEVLRTNEKFAEALVYGFVNFCTSLGMIALEATKVVNGVILGDSEKNQLSATFSQDDISKVTLRDKSFPIFNLADVVSRETPITKKLLHNESIRRAVISKYLDVFQSYVQFNMQDAQQK